MLGVYEFMMLSARSEFKTNYSYFSKLEKHYNRFILSMQLHLKKSCFYRLPADLA